MSQAKITNCLTAILLSVFFFPSLAAGQETSGEPEKSWYKGNLHTHSLWSDGNDFPDMITRWYAERDYNFLAMTDHNILSDGERWASLDMIHSRGGKTALEKYTTAMGEEWVETREVEKQIKKKNDEGVEEEVTVKKTEVRLKTLEEYRTQFEKPGKFMIMSGEEISDSVDGFPVHMNATNLVKLIRPAGGKTFREAMTNNMRSAIEQSKKEGREILVHLNHPNFGWAITAEDLAFVTLEKFFEVFNGHPSVRQLGDDNHPSVESLWDIANTIRLDKLKSAPLMGLATDDSHYYHGRPGSHPGRAWIMVRSEKLTPESILKSINAGDFYASTGIELDDVQFDDKTKKLTIQIKPVEGQTFSTRIVGTPTEYDQTSTPRLDEEGNELRITRVYSPDVGKTFATIEGTNVEFQLTGKEMYIRAVITSSADHPNPSHKDQKLQAWTQPVGWSLD